MTRIASFAAGPGAAAALLALWFVLQGPGISLDEVPLRTETFTTGPYAVGVAVGFAAAVAVARVRPVWGLGGAGVLVLLQLLFWPARFSQTSWIGYAILLPLAAIASRCIGAQDRRRALLAVVAGAVAVGALLTVPPLSMNGVEGTVYGKPWAIEPAVGENIAVWVVLCVVLALAAWRVGRPRAVDAGAEGPVDPAMPVDSATPAVDEPFLALTTRERETFLLVARGRSNADIGQELFITEATVKSHVGNLLAKLGLSSRSELIAYAYDRGIVAPSVR